MTMLQKDSNGLEHPYIVNVLRNLEELLDQKYAQTPSIPNHAAIAGFGTRGFGRIFLREMKLGDEAARFF